MTQTSPETETLKPCPFCASETIQCCFGIGGVYVIECQSCEASGPRGPDPATAINAWNNCRGHAQPAPTSPETATLNLPERITGEIACILENCDGPEHQSGVALACLMQGYQSTWEQLREVLMRDFAQCSKERIPVSMLAKHFKVSVEQAQAAQDDIGFMYRELASASTSTGHYPTRQQIKEALDAQDADTSTDAPTQRSREQVIEECANHLERKADMLTNSLHCGDNSATIAAAHKKSRQLYEAAAIISELALAPSDSSTDGNSK